MPDQRAVSDSTMRASRLQHTDPMETCAKCKANLAPAERREFPRIDPFDPSLIVTEGLRNPPSLNWLRGPVPPPRRRSLRAWLAAQLWRLAEWVEP